MWSDNQHVKTCRKNKSCSFSLFAPPFTPSVWLCPAHSLQALRHDGPVRGKKESSAQWLSLLHHVRKESPRSFVCIMFSPHFPLSVSSPPCSLLQNWAVFSFFRSVVKCLHARLCCTGVQCGSPGKMVQSMREITVWYFPSFWGYKEGKDGKFIRDIPIRQDNESGDRGIK